EFYGRLIRHFLFACGIVFASLLLGTAGYRCTEGLSWLDALLNAAMILTGMGPVNVLTRVSSKLFATFYALFSGVAFITTVGVLFAPILHRLFHRFHIEAEENDR